MPKPKLTAKQKAFVAEYLIDMNATQAAIRAGYSVKGATVRGSELLANRKVAAEIAKAQAKRAARMEVSQDSVARFLAEDRNLAHNVGQAGAAVSASMGLAKLHGLITDKAEVTGPGGVPLDFVVKLVK